MLLPGTKDSYLRGKRRFNGKLTSQAMRPQFPVTGPSGTGFAVADPWGKLKAWDQQQHTSIETKTFNILANVCHPSSQQHKLHCVQYHENTAFVV